MSLDVQALVSTDEEVVDISAAISERGIFGLDLEFVSSSKYVPDLCLVQASWGEPDDAKVVAIDVMACDVTPLVALVADPKITVVAHAAKQDLQLLAARFGIEGTRLFDTQIAAAFAGIGEQVGYAKLVNRTLGVELDKGNQFTDWAKRPLTKSQLRYALDDVRYLLILHKVLGDTLDARGRRAWVAEESDKLSAAAAHRTPPDDIYRSVSGAGSLSGRALGSLKALAAWREESALSENTPPSWIIPDVAMVEMCKRGIKAPDEMRKVRKMAPASIRKYGSDIAAAIKKGAAQPPPDRPIKRQPSTKETVYTAVVTAMVQAKSADEEIASRFVGTRAAVEELVAWFVDGRSAVEPPVLLEGWRSEFIGDDAVRWLEGGLALRASSDKPGGLA